MSARPRVGRRLGLRRPVSFALVLGACARAPAAPLVQQRCDCEYVTDLDAPGHVDVRVCARPADLESVALSCAASSGVGAVSACRCQVTTTSCADTPACVLAKDEP